MKIQEPNKLITFALIFAITIAAIIALWTKTKL